jgi:hypothetical protein
MKEISRRTTVTSSLNEISTGHPENMMVVRGGGEAFLRHPPTPFYSEILDGYLKTT